MSIFQVGELCKQVRGVSYSKEDASDHPQVGYVPILRANNIVEGELKLTDLVYVPEARVKSNQLLKKGDILIAASSGSLSVVGKAATVREDIHAGFGAFCKVLRPNNRVFPRYFGHYFQTGSYRHKVSNLAAGANINNLKNEHFDELLFYLPPLEQQKRIAAILDKADELRGKRRRAIQKLDDLLKSVFLELFGDPVENPLGLPTAHLGEVCTRVTDGTHQSPKWALEGVPFLFVSNVVDGTLDYKTSKFISEDTYQELTKRCPVEVGDILYTIVGSYGNAAMVEKEIKFSFQRHIAHLKPDIKIIDPYFLLGMVQSPGFKRQVEAEVRGIAQKTLNLRELKNLVVFRPPIQLQEQYVGIRQKILAKKVIHKRFSDQLDHLFNSLQARAFSGELTPDALDKVEAVASETAQASLF